MEREVVRYDLHFLLNILNDNHIFKIKTKKIYASLYENNIVSNNKFKKNSDSKLYHKRKSYIKETDAFSDERVIQDIRSVLGKVCDNNKKYVIDNLMKNIEIVNSKNKDTINELCKLLIQYANLCLEWNDLYLKIYNEVYYVLNKSNTNSLQFHKQLYIENENLVWNYKQYDTPEQTLFFRISNIDLFVKFSMSFPAYCIELLIKTKKINKTSITLEDWNVFYTNMFLEKIREQNDLSWIEILIHYFKCLIQTKYVQEPIKKFSLIWKKNNFIETINKIIINNEIPLKIQFKWMEITENILDN
jgi:hypothetical protein